MPRGRKKKTETAAPAPEAETEAEVQANGAGPGHNSGDLTDEQRQALALQHMRKYEDVLAAKKLADANLKNCAKLIKAELGDDGVDLVKDMIKLRTEEGEAEIKAAIERQHRAARYMAAPLGSQFSLFEDRTPAVDRAREEGKRDAMSGEPCKSPYDPSIPQHDAYIDGWHEGQKAAADLQRQRDAETFDQIGTTEGEILEDIEKRGLSTVVGEAIGDQEASYTETVN